MSDPTTGDAVASGTTPQDEIMKQYQLVRPLYEQFTSELVDLVRACLAVRGLEVHLIEGRTKRLSSLREKINRASRENPGSLSEITDLSGLRIIAYYQSDVNVIGNLLAAEFEIDKEISSEKRADQRPQEFGYQSAHYIVRLHPSSRLLLEWQHLADFSAEIQVRTVLQHAWASISHKLQYKREQDAPLILRRKLFRLSALFELADDEFMSLRQSAEALAREIEQTLSEGKVDLELNSLSVEEFLRTSILVRRLVDTALDVGFILGSFVEEKSPGVSELLQLCAAMEIHNISDLQRALEKAIPWAEDYLQRQRAASVRLWEVSPAFICELIVLHDSHSKLAPADLLQMGWSESIAERVLDVAAGRKPDVLVGLLGEELQRLGRAHSIISATEALGGIVDRRRGKESA